MDERKTQVYKCSRCKKWKVAVWLGGDLGSAIAGEFRTWREAFDRALRLA